VICSDTTTFLMAQSSMAAGLLSLLHPEVPHSPSPDDLPQEEEGP
jgi:hypothetical protein